MKRHRENVSVKTTTCLTTASFWHQSLHNRRYCSNFANINIIDGS